MLFFTIIATFIFFVAIVYLVLENKKLKNKLHEQTQITINSKNLEKYLQFGSLLKQITHQWRQPLNAISLGIQELQVIYQLQANISNEDIIRFANEADEQIKYMSQTIESIKKCFNDKQEFRNTLINEILKDALSEFTNIAYTIDGDNFIYNLDNNFKYILVGLISKCKNNNIEIVHKNNNIEIISKDKYLSDVELGLVFKPSFALFKENIIGFEPYISKIIIEQLYNGRLQACNTNAGLKFTLTLG